MIIVSIFGILSNVSSVIYFVNLRKQNAFHRLLVMLAVVDTFHLISSALTFSIANVSKRYYEHDWFYIVPISLPIAQTTMTASVYLTISLTVERYFSVVKPFFRMRNDFLKSSVALATPGFIFSILFTLPNYFMLKTFLIEDPVLETIDINEPYLKDLNWQELNMTDIATNVSTSQGLIQLVVKNVNEKNVPFKITGYSRNPKLEFAEFRSNETYIKVYVMWLHLLFSIIIPFSVLLPMNSAIYRKLVTLPRPSIRRSEEGRLRRREMRLARISVLIVIMFIICHSLKIVPSLLEILGYPPELIPGVLPVSHLLLTINCSVNFLIYYLASGRAISRLIPINSLRTIRRKAPTDRLSLRDDATLTTQYTETGF